MIDRGIPGPSEEDDGRVMPPRRIPRLDDGSLDVVASLTRWAAEARADEAARARAREAWLRRRLAEESTVVGVLADLAERGQPVMLHSAGNRPHRGIVRGLGTDFVVLMGEHGRTALIRHAAIAWVRTQPAERAALSGRTSELHLAFVDAVAVLAGERVRVRVGTTSADAPVGELREVGQDLLVLRIDGEPPAMVYLPVEAVSDLTIV